MRFVFLNFALQILNQRKASLSETAGGGGGGGGCGAGVSFGLQQLWKL